MDDNSILNSIKKMLNVAPDDSSFDTDIKIGINAALANLIQIGTGPNGGFVITGPDETWSSYLGDDYKLIEQAKTYVFLKTKLLFDPPEHAYVIDMMEQQANEMAWRLSIALTNTQINGGAL